MKHIGALDAAADPFGERPARLLRARVQILGGDFEFVSNSPALLRLVAAAYAGLPAHRMSRILPRFRIALRLNRLRSLAGKSAPPDMTLHAGAGLLCGVMDAANFAIVAPTQRAGMVSISSDMLAYPYHARYELMEFAVYTLAARAQQLLSLHAGCIGREGRGLLLIGESGAGKSTVALHCLRQGMEFVSEDSVFVAPGSMRATGVASFLHLRRDSLRFLPKDAQLARILKSPVIRRRSGVDKLEVDLRRSRYRIAAAPLDLAAVVFLSKRGASRSGLAVPLTRSQLLDRLEATQSYAAHQPGWGVFRRRVAALQAFELRRGRHPQEAAEALQRILQQ